MKTNLFIFFTLLFIVSVYGQNVGNDGPLVEVARKMKAIEGMQPQIDDFERRLDIQHTIIPSMDKVISMLEEINSGNPYNIPPYNVPRRRLRKKNYDKGKLLSVKEHIHKIHSILKSAFENLYTTSASHKRRELSGTSNFRCNNGYVALCIAKNKQYRFNYLSAVIEENNGELYDNSQEDNDYTICLDNWDDTVEKNQFTFTRMKAIESFQVNINDIERRLGIMQSVEPVLENVIKTLQKVVDVRGMGRRLEKQSVLRNVNTWYLANKDKYDLKMAFSGKKGRSQIEMLNDIEVEIHYIDSLLEKNDIESTNRRKLETEEQFTSTPLITVRDKMLSINQMTTDIRDLERRLAIVASIETPLQNIKKKLKKVVNVLGMGKL